MVRLIHEVLMEGNCYSWLCRLMSMVSFSQHHALKIRAGQGTLGTLLSPHGPEIRVALSIPPPAGSASVQGMGTASYRPRARFRDQPQIS